MTRFSDKGRSTLKAGMQMYVLILSKQ